MLDVVHVEELGGHTLQPRQQGCRVRVAGQGSRRVGRDFPAK